MRPNPAGRCFLWTRALGALVVFALTRPRSREFFTMIMMAEGTADESGKTITYRSECADPVTKQKIAMRQVLTIDDADHQTYEGYQTKDGKESKYMTIKYTRAK